MTLLAEIADKMPSTGGILAVAATAAAVCAGLALLPRAAARAVLVASLLVGGRLACGAFDDAFVSGDLRDAVWRELGWPWVLADIISPLLPAACVGCVLFVRPRRTEGRGFPIDGPPAAR